MQDWFLSDEHVSSVLVIADHDADAEIAVRSVLASGSRHLGTVKFADAHERLSQQVHLDAVLFECGDARAETVLPLVGALCATDATRIPHAAICPRLEDLDAYAGLLGDENVTLICDGDVADRLLALKMASARPATVLRDSAADVESMRLRRIADEVGRIAKALASLSEPPAAMPNNAFSDVMVGFRAEPVGWDEEPSAQSGEVSAAELRATIRMRRMRDQFFASDLFADPAWDMLLDLWAARIERTQVAVSSLCIASAVPPTTALRWIKRMTDDGILERIEDPADGRRVFIQITESTAQAMTRYWSAAQKLRGQLI